MRRGDVCGGMQRGAEHVRGSMVWPEPFPFVSAVRKPVRAWRGEEHALRRGRVHAQEGPMGNGGDAQCMPPNAS